MARTSTRVSFGLFALEMKQDSNPAADDLQPFSKVSDLRTDSATSRPYATYEPNFWLLDGNYKFLPESYTTVHVGMMTLAMSDENGDFAVSPFLAIDFAHVQSTEGIAIRFQQSTGDYANSITVEFREHNNTLIRTDDYNPTGPEFSTGQAVADFGRIVIHFHSTSRPYRYLRVTGIDYGELLVFDSTAIREASVIEDIDMLSGEVRIGTLDLRLYSADETFSIFNPSGDYANLNKRQPFAVHEMIDNQSVYIGQFYLTDWKSKGETDIEFQCSDLLWILDGINNRGALYTGETLAVVIEALLGPIAIPYELDDDLQTVQVYGWLPESSYREALQQLAFAHGAYVTCARAGLIKIRKTRIAATDLDYVAVITKAEKGQDQQVEQKELVTGVEVTSHVYTASTVTKRFLDDTLAVGTYEIKFGEPAYDLAISGGNVTSFGINYAIVNVVTPGAVVLSGKTYTDTKKVYSVYMSGLPSTVQPNILRVTDATLVGTANGQETAQRIYDYYQQRHVQTMTMFAPTVEPADIVLIDTLYSKQLRAVIETMEINLTGGMVAKVTATGVEHIA